MPRSFGDRLHNPNAIILNQGGGRAGGPIRKDKLFFVVNYEIYRLPNTYNFTRTILGDDARKGIFTYQDSVTKQVRQVNLYDLAAGGNATLDKSIRPFPTSPDPLLAGTFDQIAKLSANGTLRSRVATNNDYNRNDLLYQPTSMQNRSFLTSRIDYNVTQAHTLSLVYNFHKYSSIPDGLNSVVPIYPGTGIVLGTDLSTGQRSNRFAGTLTLRSAISPRLTNELRGGLNGGTVLFRDALAPGYFTQWKGYVPNFGSGWVSGITSTSSPSRRNSPLKHFADTVTWMKDTHQLSFGGSFDNIRLWQQKIARRAVSSCTTSPAASSRRWCRSARPPARTAKASSTSLPDAFIQNTQAAFEVGGKTLNDLNPNAPYIGPSTTPGQLGYNINLAGPWQRRLDVSILKITRIRERANIALRCSTS